MAIPAGDLAHFHVIERGGCWLRLQGEAKPIALAGGDLVVVPHGRGHSLSDSPRTKPVPLRKLMGAEAGGSCSVVSYGGGGSETRLVCGAFRFERWDAHPLLSLLPPLIHVPGSQGRAVEWLDSTLRFLADEAREGRPGAENVISRLTGVIFVQVVRAWTEQQPEGKGGWLGALRDRHVAAALGAMHHSPGQGWSVATLAAEAGLSRSSFSARFTRLVGEAPLSYLTRWRMHLAAGWLHHEDATLAEMAERIGYESEAAFSKAFKRHHGVAPGAYRRRAAQRTALAELEAL
jgi:AraC-like DNA-binding protein